MAVKEDLAFLLQKLDEMKALGLCADDKLLKQFRDAAASTGKRADACATAESYWTVLRELVPINERADELLEKIWCWHERRRNSSTSSARLLNKIKVRSKISSTRWPWRWRVRKVTRFLDKFKFQYTFASQLKDLTSEYQRTVLPETGRRRTDERGTHPADLQLSGGFVGRDEDVENIVSWLRQDRKHSLLHVIPIVGMRGIGKTTVAQMVYDHPWTKDSFDLRIWVHVLPYFDHKLVLRRMAYSVASLRKRNYSVDELVGILQEKLSGRKYLLVLDDFCQSFEIFHTLQTHLLQLSPAQGTVIVTTPRASAATTKMMASFPTYRLEGLSAINCWQLFLGQVSLWLAKEYLVLFDKVKLEIVKFLHEKCCGLPIAALQLPKHVLGRLYNFLNALTLITTQLDSFILEPSTFLTAEYSGGGSFSLSYEILPVNSRNCFRFCSLFPVDHNYCRVELEDIWIALRYHPYLTFDSFITSTSHFDELWSEFFFIQKSECSTDDKVTYKMHYLMHQLTVYLNTQSYPDGVNRGSYQMMRMDTREQSAPECLHLSLILDDGEISEFPIVLSSMKKLKTLILLRDAQLVLSHCRCKISMIPPKLLAKLQNLCVLDLQYTMIQKLPHTVGNLLNLRYLNLSGTDISFIPKSVGKLRSLMFLKLVNCRYLRKLNEVVANLVNLQKLDLSGCLFLSHVPHSIFYMEKLECLNFKDCSSLIRMPSSVGQSTNLHTLPRYIVGENDGLTISELKSLEKLEGELRVENLEKVAKGDAPTAELWNKTMLKSLTLQWKWWNHADEEKDIEAIQKVKELRPHKKLIKLEIISYMGKQFPSWLSGTEPYLASLEEIKLFNLKSCQKLPPLGVLPYLKVAEISGMDSVINVDDEFYGDNGTFPKLQKLTFSQMLKLEKWLDANRSDMFPCLKNLTIINCPKLVALEMKLQCVTELTMWLNNESLYSSKGGLKGLSGSLKKLSISLCDKLLESSECEGLQELRALEQMEISGCPELTNLPRGVRSLSSIKILIITCCNKLKVSPNLWNDELNSLHSLSIDGCSLL